MAMNHQEESFGCLKRLSRYHLPNSGGLTDKERKKKNFHCNSEIGWRRWNLVVEEEEKTRDSMCKRRYLRLLGKLRLKHIECSREN